MYDRESQAWLLESSLEGKSASEGLAPKKIYSSKDNAGWSLAERQSYQKTDDTAEERMGIIMERKNVNRQDTNKQTDRHKIDRHDENKQKIRSCASNGQRYPCLAVQCTLVVFNDSTQGSSPEKDSESNFY